MNRTPSSVRCLFAIVDRGQGETVAAELRRRHILVQLVLLGHGTASAEVMDLLGLDEPEKDLVMALARPPTGCGRRSPSGWNSTGPGGASPSPSTCPASAR